MRLPPSTRMARSAPWCWLGKAFAAGADIKEMQSINFVDAYLQDMFADWQKVDPYPQADYRGCFGLCAGRRLRDSP